VLLELNLRQEIISLKVALPELLRCLKDWSLRIARFDSEQAEITAWRESLSYQAAQFFMREEDIRRREDLVGQREKQAERVIKSVAENNAALESERTALVGAWEQITHEKASIDKAWEQIRSQETAIASAWERIRKKENA
jgi:chromosome segregation ATPase